MTPYPAHAARLLHPFRWLFPVALAACLAVPHAPWVTEARAQGHLLSRSYPGAPVPDPLAFLQPGDPVEEKKIRLSLALLKVPALDFAKTLEQDREAGSLSWHRWLLQAKAAGKLELVESFRAESTPREAFKSGYQRPQHYIRQGESSQLWSSIMQENLPHLNPEIWDDMLDSLDQSPVGSIATGEMALALDEGGVEIKLNVNCAALPEKRPSPAWVHPHFPAPKLLFPTWEYQGHVLAPLSEPFLLAAQMEPLAKEAAPGTETGPAYVWALFGRLTLSADLAEKTGEGVPLESMGGAWQAWTLDLPAQTVQNWLSTRQSDAQDGPWMQSCLNKALSGGDIRLRSVMSGASAMGKSTRLTEDNDIILRSVVKWNDSTGFEPTHNDRIFRPCVAEDDEFSRRYELHIQASGTSGMVLPPGGTTPWQVAQVGLSQPSTPLVWRRWKHAMEGTEQDEGNLELADAPYREEEGLSLEMLSAFPPGKAVLLNTTQQGERMLVTFARAVDGTPPPQVPPAPAPPPQAPVARDPFGPGGGPSEAPPHLHTTIWQIDTPLDWMAKAFALEPDQAGHLATQLLEATRQGKATVVAMNARRQISDNGAPSRWNATQPVNFYGGPYVNTAPHAKGIYFNMRHLEQVSAGAKERLEVSLEEQTGLAVVNAELIAIGTPAWQQWGIWQPSVSGTNVTNSGIKRPAFPTGLLHLSAKLPPGQPQVVAVATAPDAAAPGARGSRLRWWVIGVNKEDQPAPARTAETPAPARSSLVQAVILPLPKSEAIPTDSQALAERLLAEAAAGTRAVHDVSTVLRLGTRDYTATLTSGTDYYFTNGRTHPYTEDQAALINAPAVMPPDSKYDDQINLQNRIVGTRLFVNEETWTLTRDVTPPQVVTDTFQDVRYEFPWQEEETAKRTAVSVQRPIFQVIKKEQPLPTPGRPIVVRLTDEIVVVVRAGGS
ncbi:hypothetical protein [Verrucomicrobium sp. BvORR106]|uniref:hypothetical protein n=1 Tax=Verrucomicrobium sp. BvORR106 TaxID=1403819 RepID=UPI00224105B3|nr:hypothetical protein [Verrucomicrobium sp. BvORR106]